MNQYGLSETKFDEVNYDSTDYAN